MWRLVDGLDAPPARSPSGEAHQPGILQGDLVQRRPVAFEHVAQEALGDDAVHHDGCFLAVARILFDRLDRTRLDVCLRLAARSGEAARIRIYLGDCLRGVALAARLSLPCLLYTSPSPRDQRGSRMPSSA